MRGTSENPVMERTKKEEEKTDQEESKETTKKELRGGDLQLHGESGSEKR